MTTRHAHCQPHYSLLLRRLAGAFGLALLLVPPAVAAPLVLLIQPILGESQTRQTYQPLADYLGRVARREVTILAPPNHVAYWGMVRRNQGFDLVLDEAHFTDYRVQRHGFDILAKAPDTMSYSLVVPNSLHVLDPMELIGKSVAMLGLPSIGAVRLTAMYLNPARQPHFIEVASAEEALDLMARQRVHAAILPTPFVSRRMESARIRAVMTTEPIPHIALSASPGMDVALRERLRVVLLNADKSAEGRQMLEAIGFERFEPATPELYAGQHRILQKYWGY
jgi:hypothetical protein